MMNADDIKKGIECMKAQEKSLEKEMLDLKTHLAGAFTTWEARSLSWLQTESLTLRSESKRGGRRSISLSLSSADFFLHSTYTKTYTSVS